MDPRSPAAQRAALRALDALAKRDAEDRAALAEIQKSIKQLERAAATYVSRNKTADKLAKAVLDFKR